MYDPELPAGFQDADFEMRELEYEGNAIARGRKAGRCQHTSVVGLPTTLDGPLPGGLYYPEQEGLKPGQHRCTEGCGRVFENTDEWVEAMHEARIY